MFYFQHPVTVDVEPEVRKTVLKMPSTNVNVNTSVEQLLNLFCLIIIFPPSLDSRSEANFVKLKSDSGWGYCGKECTSKQINSRKLIKNS